MCSKRAGCRRLLPKGLHIREASLSGAPLAIVEGPAGTGTRSLLLSRKGRVGVTLEVVVPVATRAGVESLTLPPSPGGLVSAALTVPRSGVDVTVSGGLIVDRTSTGPVLRVVSHASLGQALSLSWQRTRDTARSRCRYGCGARCSRWSASERRSRR